MYLVILDPRSNDPVVRERVEGAIKLMGNWSNRMTNCWMLESKNKGARQIRDDLKPFLGDQDRLFVARISRNWAGRGMGEGFPEWIGRRDFGTFNEQS
jgi:hypothetical protein